MMGTSSQALLSPLQVCLQQIHLPIPPPHHSSSLPSLLPSPLPPKPSAWKGPLSPEGGTFIPPVELSKEALFQ